jgi:hypothetical protein
MTTLGLTTLTRDELWKRLSEAGLVSGDLPVAAESQSPWPVRAMLGIAGWVGALFLLGFAGVAFAMLFRSAEAALPAGAICCLAAYGIFRATPRNDFFAQFGFAVSLAGQGLLMVGLAHLAGDRPDSVTFLLMAAVEAALALAIPNYIHRVFTTVAANFCLFIAAAITGVPALATVVAAIGVAVIWLNQIRMAERPSLWQPLGYGFAIALLHLDGSLMIGPEFWTMLLPRDAPAPHFVLWAGPVVAGLVFVYVVWQLRERAGVEPDSPGGIVTVAAAIVVALCGLAAPGISAAILVLALGFANGSRVLMGLGLLSFGGYLSHFYYQLSSTLLVKSMVLAATGTALLGLRWIIERFPRAEESTNA